MMKNSKNRHHGHTDQVMERFQRARESFNGAWRCRPCAGDFISPSPRPRQRGEQKKVLKKDISKDPLFLKPPQPTPAREDDRLAVEGGQEGHAKENERKDSKSERGKIDGQLQSASQQDPDELKNLEERDAADSQSQGGKMYGDLQTSAQKVQDELKVANEDKSNLENGAEDSQVNDQLQPTSQRDEDSLKAEDETQGKLERGDEISPQMGPAKTEDLDLLELPKNATVSGEGAGDRVEDLVSPDKQVHGVPEDHFDPLKLETLEEFGTTNSTRPSFPGDQFGAENLESPGDQNTDSKESSGMIKSGLNINIPHSESYSLHEAEFEKVKAIMEENESPVSVLLGIPDLETPKAEDGKLDKTRKESESHKSVQGFPEVENHHKGPHLGPESSKEVDPANNIITSLCAFLKLESAQLERPSEDVQRNSSDFSDISNTEKELGTPQAYADSLHQTEDQKNFHHSLQVDPKQDSKSTPEGLNDFGIDAVGETEGPSGDHVGVFSEGKGNIVEAGTETGHSEDGLKEEKQANLEPHDMLYGMQGQGKELDEGKLKPESSESLEQLHSNSPQEEKNPAVQDSVQNKASHALHGNEKQLEIPGNYSSMSSQSSDFREEGRELEGENLHNAEDEKLEDGEKINDGLHQKPVQDGALGETKHDGFPQSERLEALLAGKGSTLHGMAATSIQGTGEDGSSQLYPDHPAYTELRPISHHGEHAQPHSHSHVGEHAQPHSHSHSHVGEHSHIHREESNSFKIGYCVRYFVLGVALVIAISYLHLRQTLWESWRRRFAMLQDSVNDLQQAWRWRLLRLIIFFTSV